MRKYNYSTLITLILLVGLSLNLYTQGGGTSHGIYYVNDYGIVADSIVLQTAQINGLIQLVHKSGGGTIFFASGTYKTGPITLLSNVTFCIFDGTDRGIRIKSTRGRGGVVEGIRVNNVLMRNILKEAVMLNLFYSEVPEEPVSERTPAFRDIHISNVTGEAKQAVRVFGLPERPVSNISFNDVIDKTVSKGAIIKE